MDRIKVLQESLQLSTGIGAVRNNRELIDAELKRLDDERAVVLALKRANQELCTHPNKESYADSRDGGGWDCPDCGASR